MEAYQGIKQRANNAPAKPDGQLAMIDVEKFSRSLDDLILISINSVLRRKKHCTYGDLVKECFTLFPQEFALTDYPELPDSLKLDRPLRKLTHTKRFVKGSPKTFYSLTNAGREEISRILKHQTNTSKKAKPTRSPGLNALVEIRQSDEYKKYLDSKTAYIPSNMRLRYLIKFTLETPPAVVYQHLKYLREIAEKLPDRDMTTFLDIYMKFFKGEK